MVELVWRGKYDNAGKRVGPLRIQLPFQTIETVNESSQDRQRMLERFTNGMVEKEWQNRLIWGDKKYVLPSLLPEFGGKIDLVYMDPPFFTGTDQQLIVEIPESDNVSEQPFSRQPSIIEESAYRNVWRDGADSFCQWMSDTLSVNRELLSPRGAIFIRHDQYWSHTVKLIADEVFGRDNFQNEIVVNRTHKNLTQQGRVSVPIATDSLFLYFTGPESKFENITTSLGRRREGYWRRIDDSSGIRHPLERKIFGKTFYPPPGKHFKFSQERMEQMIKTGKIRLNTKTGRPQYWVEATETVVLDSNWTDIPGYSFTTGYPTENSEALLERAVKACTKEGDLVLDCFAGSGTTAVVSERLKRRWITCDISRFSVHTTRKRLLSIPGVRPFLVQNLGKYERQAWQTTEFGGEMAAKLRSYVGFILNLYGAQPLNGYVWLHGKKRERFVHVGAVDSPVSSLDVGQIVAEFIRAMGSGKDAPKSNGIDVLGWEFAFDLNELAKQQASQTNVDVRFLRIPREALDKRAVEQGDVHFFELASLSVGVKTTGLKAKVAINDFVIPQDNVPADVQRQVKHWSQWIDYWEVDWDNRNDTFHNEVQEYRTKVDPKLATELYKTYDSPGEYRVLVKVIDILGNDTTKLLKVKVR